MQPETFYERKKKKISVQGHTQNFENITPYGWNSLLALFNVTALNMMKWNKLLTWSETRNPQNIVWISIITCLQDNTNHFGYSYAWFIYYVQNTTTRKNSIYPFSFCLFYKVLLPKELFCFIYNLPSFFRSMQFSTLLCVGLWNVESFN